MDTPESNSDLTNIENIRTNEEQLNSQTFSNLYDIWKNRATETGFIISRKDDQDMIASISQYKQKEEMLKKLLKIETLIDKPRQQKEMIDKLNKIETLIDQLKQQEEMIDKFNEIETLIVKLRQKLQLVQE